MTVVVYAATNIYLSTQRGSHYHPVPSLRRKRHAYPSERLMAGLEEGQRGEGGVAKGAKRIMKEGERLRKREREREGGYREGGRMTRDKDKGA